MQLVPKSTANATTRPLRTLRPSVERWLDSRWTDQRQSLEAGTAPTLTADERVLIASEHPGIVARLAERAPEQLGPLLAETRELYGHGDIGEAAYRLWMEALFGEDGFPPYAIRAAFMAHIKACEFFPKPAEIRRHAAEAVAADRVRLHKLEQALKLPHDPGIRAG